MLIRTVANIFIQSQFYQIALAVVKLRSQIAKKRGKSKFNPEYLMKFMKFMKYWKQCQMIILDIYFCLWSFFSLLCKCGRLPIYINEIPQIDHTLDSASINNNSVGPLTDDVIINNSSIAHSLMIFSEIYLAYRFADSKQCPKR